MKTAECHCDCGWSGYYDDCNIYTEREPRGEFCGLPVFETLYIYNCPSCRKEVKDGPPKEEN